MKKILYVFILPTLILLSGCGFKDIDKRFFVVTIGVDKAEKIKQGYNVVVKLALPGPPRSPANEPNYIVMSEEAETIAEALRLIKSKVDKELDFGHMKAIIIGKKVAQHDLSELMDWFARRRDIQQIAWVMIGSPTAKKIMEQKPLREQIPSDVLFTFFGNIGTETPYIASVPLFDFLRRLKEPGIDPVLPVLKQTKDSIYQINTVSILKNGKVALTLTRDETRLLNLIMQDQDKTEIKVKEKNKPFIITTTYIRHSYSVHTSEKTHPYVAFSATIKGRVEEAHTPVYGFDLKKYGTIASNVTEKNLKALLQKLQQAGVDPLGFGIYFRAHRIGNEEEKYREWKKLYPKLQFRVHVQTEVKGTGLTKQD